MLLTTGMITLISLILFVSRLAMMAELKYGPTWRRQRAERWAIKEEKKKAKRAAKADARMANGDQEKQLVFPASPNPQA
jgi:hypothetical protein